MTRATQERTQDRTGELQRHNDALEPLQEITAMGNYVGVGRRANDRDPGTASLDMALAAEVTEDA